MFGQELMGLCKTKVEKLEQNYRKFLTRGHQL